MKVLSPRLRERTSTDGFHLHRDLRRKPVVAPQPQSLLLPRGLPLPGRLPPRSSRLLASVVHISSTRARQSEPDSEGYAASKAGLLGLTHAQAASLDAAAARGDALAQEPRRGMSGR